MLSRKKENKHENEPNWNSADSETRLSGKEDLN